MIGVSTPDCVARITRSVIRGRHLCRLFVPGLRRAQSGLRATFGGTFVFRTARGTGASPANQNSGDLIGVFGARPYTNGAFAAANVARIGFFYGDSSPNLGTYIEFDTTPAGSTTRAQAMRVFSGVIIGTGTTDPGAGNLTVGGSVGIGTAAPTAPLTITAQTATLPTPLSGTLFHMIGSNGSFPTWQYNAYGAYPGVWFFRANGSLGSETTIGGSGQNGIGGLFGFRGYDGTAYSIGAAYMYFPILGTWSTSNHGAGISYLTTPQNSTAGAVAMSIYGGVIVGNGTTDPGAGNLTVGGAAQIGAPTGGILSAGTLNVGGGIYLNNSAYTNPDFVFEQYFTGAVQKYADRPRAKSYTGLMPLDDLAVHIRESLRLPGIDDRPTDIFERGDIALEKLEEHTLYILGLHARVTALESRLQ